jgi:general secretion pathway protein M
MRDWFDSLAPRERLLVTAGGVLVVVLVFWAIILAPLSSKVRQLSERVEGKKSTLAWMSAAAAEITSAGAVAASAGNPDQSLVVVIDRTARQSGLGETITRNQPVGDDGIRVRMEGAGFDTVTQWLGQLQTAHGLSLEAATFERGSVNGTVTASITLRQPS